MKSNAIRGFVTAIRTVGAAILATFNRCGTPIPTDRSPGLSAAMIKDETKQRQWRAYVATLELDLSFEVTIDAVWKLVGPSCERLLAKSR